MILNFFQAVSGMSMGAKVIGGIAIAGATAGVVYSTGAFDDSTSETTSGKEGKASGKSVSAAPATPTTVASNIEFDGRDDFLQINNHAKLDGGEQYTFEAWVYPQAKHLGGIISKRENSNDNTSYSFLIAPVRGQNRLFFKVNWEDDDFYSDTPIPLHQWTHVAAVFDGKAPAAERKKLYVNGKLAAKGRSRLRKVNGFKTKLSLGVLLGNKNSFFDGRLDEVKVWERALDESEIAQNMCSSLTGNEESLIGYWKFDESSGNIVHNYSQLEGLDATFKNIKANPRVKGNACPEMIISSVNSNSAAN